LQTFVTIPRGESRKIRKNQGFWSATPSGAKRKSAGQLVDRSIPPKSDGERASRNGGGEK